MSEDMVRIPNDVCDALVKVVDYLYRDEKRSYDEDRAFDDVPIPDHIFLSVDKVSKWLDRSSIEPAFLRKVMD